MKVNDTFNRQIIQQQSEAEAQRMLCGHRAWEHQTEKGIKGCRSCRVSMSKEQYLLVTGTLPPTRKCQYDVTLL
ncbi:hypothetical protein N9B10_00445 [Pirellulales bacterium]|nr:hypothetical protein [Pirellulales bacterium]